MYGSVLELDTLRAQIQTIVFGPHRTICSSLPIRVRKRETKKHEEQSNTIIHTRTHTVGEEEVHMKVARCFAIKGNLSYFLYCVVRLCQFNHFTFCASYSITVDLTSGSKFFV